MKRNYMAVIISLLCCAMLLASCSSQGKGATDDDTDEKLHYDKGTIIHISDNGQQWLVTQYRTNADHEPYVDAMTYTINNDTLIKREDGQALAPEEVQVGQQVKAWTKGPVMESYPTQAQAGTLIVLDEDDHMPVSASEAVRTSLEHMETSMPVAVKTVVFIETGGFWKVEIVHSNDPTELNTFQIDAESGAVIQDVVAENEVFRLFAPTPQEQIDAPLITVSGEANVFEGTFLWSLEDGHDILASGEITVEQGAPEWAAFDFEVAFDQASSPGLSLILYTLSAKDGQIEHQLIVPLTASDELIERHS